MYGTNTFNHTETLMLRIECVVHERHLFGEHYIRAKTGLHDYVALGGRDPSRGLIPVP